MKRFYTRRGDDGYTGLLGEGRVAKYDPRIEAVGTLDEANAALGFARATAQTAASQAILLVVQRDLYGAMAEVSADPENAAGFRTINMGRVGWLEEQTDALSQTIEMPKEFIVPGDTPAGAALDLARTIVRRAERQVANLFHRGDLENEALLNYLNRLSSLCFALELLEIHSSGKIKPTLAKLD